MDVISMAHRSATQHLLMLTASTALAAGGVLLPTSAVATPETPGVGTIPTVAAWPSGHGHPGITNPGVEWVETTDAPSGITAKLPGKAKVEKKSIPVDGKSVNARSYGVETADGGVGFIVHD
ncbi:hypothetical protein ACFVW1_54505, partial [Streptomyces olivochromogenes]